MQGNPDQEASSSQDAPSDLRTSNGEVVRRVDLDRAAGTPGKFTHENPDVAGYDGVELARAALAGDHAALDEFHARAGLALPGVTEHCEEDVVRLVTREVGEEVAGLEVQGVLVRQLGEVRAMFRATTQGGDDCTLLDAAELVAWILSPQGRAALARRGVAVPAPALPGALTPDEAIAAARNVGVDLTCGECAALFFTGHPSSLSGPPAHALLCKTERIPRRVLAVSCTCGTWQVEAGATPPVCPRCDAPERAPVRATDYVARPWEELDARRRMYGVFHAEGHTPDPVAIFRTEDVAARWLTWQKTLGDDAEVGTTEDYTIMPVDQLDGVAWNSYEPPPAKDAHGEPTKH